MIFGTHGDKVKLEDQCLLLNELKSACKGRTFKDSYLTDLSSITQKLDEGNMKILFTMPFASK